ncbi:isatin hydrolase-like [Mytilus californianus]|uniref:isatin hydrolase-like n=1 Tax=Mytilus californianus TaxID=6549 RepID=UPI0022451154|nr:isatin hydrolase-like [Mytilus californianus]
MSRLIFWTLFIVGYCSHLDFDIVDLSHTIGPTTIRLPFYPPYNFTVIKKYFDENLNIWIEENWFGMAEHTNTHVDAPAHMFRGRPFMNEVPLEKMVGPGVIIDVTEKVAVNFVYGVMVDDLLNWEAQFGKIPDYAVVIMNSGWYKKYPDPELVFGSQNWTNMQTHRFPSWTIDAVEWLLCNRHVLAVGVDTPSVDLRGLGALPVHKRLFRESIIALEGVANLDAIPPCKSTIFIPPLKLYKGSGAPARIFATVPKMKHDGYNQVKNAPSDVNPKFHNARIKTEFYEHK